MTICQHNSTFSLYLSPASVIAPWLLSAACVSHLPRALTLLLSSSLSTLPTPLSASPLSQESDTGLPLLRKQPW